MAEGKRLLRTREAANHTGLSVQYLSELARTGQIPCFKVGSVYRWDPAELDAWLEQHRQGPKVEPVKASA
jgi:excisionase family DNA binding protein